MNEEEQNNDGDVPAYSWLNQAFRVPLTQVNPRTFYPWSSSLALEYRAKLVIILMNLAAATFLAEKPCDRYGVLFNCSAVFFVCNKLYKNYPWRQPLTNYVWKILCFWPTTQILFYFVLLIASQIVKLTCALSLTSHIFLTFWAVFIIAWFFIDATWKHKYVDLEKERPITINFSSYIEHLILLFVISPKYDAFYSIWLYGIWGILLFQALWIDLFISKEIQLFVLGFFAISCLKMVFVYLKLIGVEATTEWGNEEKIYSGKVINCLKEVLNSLPSESGESFDELAIAVPYLQQEASILQNAKYVDKETKGELQNLIKDKKIADFRESLRDYTPYSTECCIS